MEHLREIHKIGIKKFEYNETLPIAGKCMAGLRILLIMLISRGRRLLYGAFT